MAPIDERGAIWKYTPEPEGSWELLTPADPSAPYPPARSYHAMTSSGSSTLYLHAGCPESGRLSDLWAFDISSRSWEELAAAPDPQRGGTSIAWAAGKLWRMNGFDGKTEQGGAVDIYDPYVNKWSTISFIADNVQGPGPRSVGALLPVAWGGRTFLLTMFGEQDPSALGHAGAGKMKNDVWAFDLQQREWSQVEMKGDAEPDARGWFAADTTELDGKDVAIVHGGLAEGNDRLGDAWILRYD